MRSAALAAAAAALLAAACVSLSLRARADRAYRDGDLEAAAGAYEQLLERSPGGPREAHALYRLALVHCLPGSPLRDDARADQLLARLVADHPGSDHAPQARLILDLRRRTAHLQQMGNDLAANLRQLRDQAQRAVTELQAEMGRVQGEAEAKEQRIAQLERQIAGLRGQIAGFDREVASLEEELRRLKEIDLALPP